MAHLWGRSARGGEGTCPRRLQLSEGQEEPDGKDEPTKLAQVRLDLDVENDHDDYSTWASPGAQGHQLASWHCLTSRCYDAALPN